MSQEPRYYIRQAGGAAQGPYEFSRIAGYRDAGRINREMEFSEDGQTWWCGNEWPALFPTTSPTPVPVSQRPSTRPQRRTDSPQRRPRRQQRRSSNGPLIAAIVLVVAGGAVAIALTGRGEAPSRSDGSRSTTALDPEPPTRTQHPGAPVRVEAKPARDERLALIKKRGTKRQFRKRIAEVMESPGGIGYGDEKKFVEALGEPDKTQTLGDSIYWYYTCTNGTIQIVIAGVLHHGGGLVVTAINDY